MKNKFKRIEWLNVFGKGFIVESINNNYKNEDFTIKKQTNELSNEKNKLFNNNKGDKNIRFKKINSSKPEKENITSKKEDIYYYMDLKEFFPDENDNNNLKKEMTVQQDITPKQEVKIKKDKKIKKNNSTININFINIQQNIIQNTSKNQKVINYKNTSRRKEIKTDISSPLLNYIKTQKKNTKIRFKAPINKEENKLKVNSQIHKEDKNKEKKVNEKTKIKNVEFNLNLKQYINNNNGLKALKYNLRNKIKYENNESKNLADIGDYTFDGESLFSEQKIDDDFSDIFTKTINDDNSKNKKNLNIFYSGNINSKDFKKNQFEEISKIIKLLNK